MCTFDYRVQSEVFHRPFNREEFIQSLQRIGVLDENENFTPKYSFFEKYGKRPATI